MWEAGGLTGHTLPSSSLLRQQQVTLLWPLHHHPSAVDHINFPSNIPPSLTASSLPQCQQPCPRNSLATGAGKRVGKLQVFTSSKSSLCSIYPHPHPLLTRSSVGRTDLPLLTSRPPWKHGVHLAEGNRQTNEDLHLSLTSSRPGPPGSSPTLQYTTCYGLSTHSPVTPIAPESLSSFPPYSLASRFALF